MAEELPFGHEFRQHVKQINSEGTFGISADSFSGNKNLRYALIYSLFHQS